MNPKGYLLLLVVAALTSSCRIEEAWDEVYGGPQSDGAYSIQQTRDSGFVFSGCSVSFGQGMDDVWVVKADRHGNEQWSHVYGGPLVDRSFSIQQTRDGGFIIGGWTNSFSPDGSFDFYVLKLDGQGNLLWERVYGGSGNEYAWSAVETWDGGYLIAGETDSFGSGDTDMWVVKLDRTGNKEWDQTYGGGESDRAYNVQATLDGGYVLAGETKSFGAGNSDVWAVKIDSQGVEQWSRTYGGEAFDCAYHIRQTRDGGYVIAGGTESWGVGLSDFLVIRTNHLGKPLWKQALGGEQPEWAYSVQEAREGGFVAAGVTWSQGQGDADIWLVKLDGTGALLTTETYGGQGDDWAISVIKTYTGYMLAGFTDSIGAGDWDAWILKLYSVPDCGQEDRSVTQ